MIRKHQSSKTSSNLSKTAKKARYRVRNWREYNESLVKRYSLTLWISDEDIGSWKPLGPKKRGGQVRYTDGAIQCLLMLRSVFRLPLRGTEGFVRSIFELMGLELCVPDYTTICKRSKCLSVSMPKEAKGPVHAVLDSTRLKVFGEGEWKVRQHGYAKRRTWRKLHLAVDSNTHEIQAVVLSESSLDDAGVVADLLEQITEPIEQLDADGAYDKRKVYNTCQEHGIDRVAIPPRIDARIWQHGNCASPPLVRDENLRQIRRMGRRGREFKSHRPDHHRFSAKYTYSSSKLELDNGDVIKAEALRLFCVRQ